MSLHLFRKASRFDAGISCGGGDTGWTEQPQPILLTKTILPGSPVKAALPAGAILLEVWILTEPALPATVGTLDIVDNTGVYYASAVAINAPARLPLATPGALTVDTGFTFKTTGADGAVVAGFLCVPQRPRK